MKATMLLGLIIIQTQLVASQEVALHHHPVYDYLCDREGYVCVDKSTLGYCPKADSQPELLIYCRGPKSYCDAEKKKCSTILAANTNGDGNNNNSNNSSSMVLKYRIEEVDGGKESSSETAIHQSIQSPNEADDTLMGSCRKGEYLPHPIDCKKYIYCTKSGAPLIFQCVTGTVYDQTSSMCVQGVKCNSVTAVELCQDKVHRLVAYSLDRSLYIFCFSHKAPRIASCPNKYLVFNEETWSCDMVCTSAGMFPHWQYENLYYICIKTPKGYILYVGECPNGTVFDSESKTCEF